MSFLLMNSQEIYYSFRNHHASQNLILIHGAGGSEAFWPLPFKKNQIANYYAIDLPGHGKSKRKGFTSISQYAELVQNFVEKLKLNHVVLLGHSMGGAIALSVALQRPAWLSRLVLIGAGGKLTVHPLLLEKLQNDFEGAIELILKNIYGDQISSLLMAEAKRSLHRIGQQTLLNDFIACNQFDQIDRLHEIKIPTLVIVGEKDRSTPVEYSELLHSKIQGSTLKIIPDGHHMVFLEQPEEVNKELIHFLG